MPRGWKQVWDIFSPEMEKWKGERRVMDRRNCVVDFMMLDILIYLLLKSLTLFSLTKSIFLLLTQSVSVSTA